MSGGLLTHFVFVDFENVPEVDLGAIRGQPVHVTLLIGKNQKKIALELVEQIQEFAAQVKLIKVGATGHNALDLTLACYLGRAIERAPAANFAIVSGDKDFAPMIAHLLGQAVEVARYDSFTALSFLHHRKPSAPPKHSVATKPAPAPKKSPEERRTKPAGPAQPASPPIDRFEKLVIKLRNGSAPRPKKKTSLLAQINTDFGNKLNDSECASKLDELIRRGVVTIGDQDKVVYHDAF